MSTLLKGLLRFLCLIGLLFCQSFLSAAQAQSSPPPLSWLKGMRSDGPTSKVAIDAWGNCYLAGEFRNELKIDSVLLLGRGVSQAFIAKFDPSGRLLWLTGGGATGECTVAAFALDGAGSCYITGIYDRAVNFGSVTVPDPLSPQGVYVAKFDASGTCLWATHSGRAAGPAPAGIAVDRSGNCYTTGSFEDGIEFGTTSLVNYSGYDSYVAKLDQSGNFTWVMQMECSYTIKSSALALDSSGYCYIAGFFTGTAYIGRDSLQQDTAHSGMLFLTKLDADGNYAWAIKAGCTAWTAIRTLAVDQSGHAYIAGSYYRDLTLGGITLTDGPYFSEIFVAKADPLGNFLWAKQAGSLEDDAASGLALDNAGGCYVTGLCRNRALFDTIRVGATARYMAFVAKLDSTGAYDWVMTSHPDSASSSAISAAVDGAGNCYILGSGAGHNVTIGGLTVNVHSWIGYGYFLAKMGNYVGAPEVREDAAQAAAYPNPFRSRVTVAMEGAPGGKWQGQLQDVLGRTAWSGTLSSQAGAATVELPPALPAGMYLLQLSQDERRLQVKLLKE